MVFNYPDAHNGQHPVYEALGLAFQETVLGSTRFKSVRYLFSCLRVLIFL